MAVLGGAAGAFAAAGAGLASKPLLCKVVLVGDAKAGKSSLLSRWSMDNFSEYYEATVSPELTTKDVRVPGVAAPIRLQVWDTGFGEPGANAQFPQFCNGAGGAALVYDATAAAADGGAAAAEAVGHWHEQVRSLARGNCAFVVVACKSDLRPAPAGGPGVPTKVAQLCQAIGAQHIETSSKSGAGVGAAFEKLAAEIGRRALNPSIVHAPAAAPATTLPGGAPAPAPRASPSPSEAAAVALAAGAAASAAALARGGVVPGAEFAAGGGGGTGRAPAAAPAFTSGVKRPLKIVLLGDSKVGKSSLAAMLGGSDPAAIPEEYVATAGPEIQTKQFTIAGTSVRIQLWDASGHDLLNEASVRTAILSKLDGAFLVYDTATRASFDSLGRWMKLLEDFASDETSLMILGNKADGKAGARCVTQEQGSAFGEALRVPFAEVSSRSVAFGTANNIVAALLQQGCPRPHWSSSAATASSPSHSPTNAAAAASASSVSAMASAKDSDALSNTTPIPAAARLGVSASPMAARLSLPSGAVPPCGASTGPAPAALAPAPSAALASTAPAGTAERSATPPTPIASESPTEGAAKAAGGGDEEARKRLAGIVSRAARGRSDFKSVSPSPPRLQEHRGAERLRPKGMMPERGLVPGYAAEQDKRPVASPTSASQQTPPPPSVQPQQSRQPSTSSVSTSQPGEPQMAAAPGAALQHQRVMSTGSGSQGAPPGMAADLMAQTVPIPLAGLGSIGGPDPNAHPGGALNRTQPPQWQRGVGGSLVAGQPASGPGGASCRSPMGTTAGYRHSMAMPANPSGTTHTSPAGGYGGSHAVAAGTRHSYGAAGCATSPGGVQQPAAGPAANAAATMAAAATNRAQPQPQPQQRLPTQYGSPSAQLGRPVGTSASMSNTLPLTAANSGGSVVLSHGMRYPMNGVPMQAAAANPSARASGHTQPAGASAFQTRALSPGGSPGMRQQFQGQPMQGMRAAAPHVQVLRR